MKIIQYEMHSVKEAGIKSKNRKNEKAMKDNLKLIGWMETLYNGLMILDVKKKMS